MIWRGLGSDNNWSTSSNWNIRAPQYLDVLQFAGTTRTTSFNDLTIDTPYNGITSTQENLFVGTREECDQYIIDENLYYAIED